ncbi:MAG: type II toxin-antitoxin system RelE/ParE family toxin [Bryobacteraceae bacterium]
MSWAVEIGDEFEPQFDALHEDVQAEILAVSLLLQQFGPQLGRPRVDTLKGSRHGNMKELRFSAADGEWRVAFAFDPKRKAILLVAGDKSGGSEKRFYRELLRKADDRFDAHLDRLKRQRK